MRTVIAIPVLLLLALWQSPVFAESGYQIVVNPANPVGEVDQKFLADVFLKKTTFWSEMKSILVVDQYADSRVRHQFSEEILNRPVSAIRIYWQQLLFSGRGIPPPELKNDQEVIGFVASHEEAIGYVSGGADLHGLKPLRIR